MDALVDRMKTRGLELLHAPTDGPRHATEIVRSNLTRDLDVVVACGGDGTISEVACGLGGSSVPLAILPGGTSNVLARELAIPLDMAAAEELLFSGAPRAVPLYLANDRPFLLWAGVGLDARIMAHMNWNLKRWLGRAGIFWTVAQEFFRYEFPRLAVTVDGVSREATFAVVCHARRYAGAWVIAPEAALGSGQLHLLAFEGRSRSRFLSLFRQIQLGRSGHLSRGIATIARGRTVTITSLENYPVEVQVDGDCVLETPIECRAAGKTVQILAPGGKL
jgi:diacylglycerol kinase (ATP)